MIRILSRPDEAFRFAVGSFIENAWFVLVYRHTKANMFPLMLHETILITGTCFIQKIYAPSSSVLQGKHLPFTPFPLRLNIFRLIVILSLTQLYRYTPEIFLFSIATFKYKYRAPSDELDKNIQRKSHFLFFSQDRACVTMPSWSSPLKCKVNF